MNVFSFDDVDFAEYLHETDEQSKIRGAWEYIDDMADLIGTTKERVIRFDLPWDKTRNAFGFSPGEVTLWAGASGNGKSLVTGMVALDLICKNQRVCIASLEMPVRKTLQRMLRGFLGIDPVCVTGSEKEIAFLKEQYRDFSGLAHERLWLYDQLGSITPDKAVAVARYCAKKLGIQHLFIDSLMKCVPGTDNYNAQKDFVNELCAIGKDYGMTVHLVAHTKKMTDEKVKPNKYSVHGAGDITNLVDNVLLFWRNKAKEEAFKVGADSYDEMDPDALLICCKQRETGDEPEFALWFDKQSQSFVEAKGMEPINWVEKCL